MNEKSKQILEYCLAFFLGVLMALLIMYAIKEGQKLAPLNKLTSEFPGGSIRRRSKIRK